MEHEGGVAGGGTGWMSSSPFESLFNVLIPIMCCYIDILTDAPTTAAIYAVTTPPPPSL